LPAQLAAYTPASGAFLGQPSLAFFESDLLPSYDVVRAQAAAFGLARVPTSGFSNLQAPALPANGTLRITAISPGG
jgi:hypothetical protein